MLHIKLLSTTAKLPTVGHPGEDLGFDLYASETVTIPGQKTAKIKTGIAAQFTKNDGIKYGLLIRDRSSLASQSLVVTGGVIDSSYTGEISVVMYNSSVLDYFVKEGSKIAQMIPIPVMTGCGVLPVDELPNQTRGSNGFGSTGN